MAEITEVLETHANEVPVPIFKIIQDMGIELRIEDLDDEISGWIERLPAGNYRVVINRGHPITRQRFTAAHELAHFLYHRDLLGAGTGDTRAYRAERTPFANEAIRPRHERQANTFAANILMPPHLISRLEANGVTDLDELASALAVSKDAMRIQLG